MSRASFDTLFMRDLWHNEERMMYAMYLRAHEIFFMLILVVNSSVLLPHALRELEMIK